VVISVVFCIRQVPLQMQIRELSDAGKPIVLSKPDSDAAAVYRHIASRIVAMLNKGQQRGPPIIKLD
jgi:ATP-binding protein involved in chromosome partitioning